MGLTSSSCMSSHSVSSPVISKNKRNKKSRIDLFPKPNLSKDNQNEKKHPELHKKRIVVDKLQSVESSLRIDTSDDQEFEVAMPDDLDESEHSFIESNDRNPIVRFSYSEGINQQYTLHDDPTYFIGWEVYPCRIQIRNQISVLLHTVLNILSSYHSH
jgi:hypothetical protein